MSDPSTLDPPPPAEAAPRHQESVDVRALDTDGVVLGRGIVGADRGEDGMRLGLYFVVDTH
jgi:hypothetical protein